MMGTLLKRCEAILTYSAITSTFIMMCLTTADAVGRYVFNRPIIAAYEIAENYLMVTTVFLGICYAYRTGAYIRVTFLVDRLPQKVKVVLDYFVQIFSILLSILLVIATILQARSTIVSGMTLSILPIPVGPAYVIVPVGFFFATLLMVLDLRQMKTGNSAFFHEGSSDI